MEKLKITEELEYHAYLFRDFIESILFGSVTYLIYLTVKFIVI